MAQSWETPIDPDEVKDYRVNWAERLDDSDTIVTSTWIVPDDITKDSDSHTTTTATIWLSVPTLGSNYELVNRVTTAGGRTLDQTCKLKCRTL